MKKIIINNFLAAICSIIITIFLFKNFISEVLYRLISPGIFLCYSFITLIFFFIYLILIFITTKKFPKYASYLFALIYFIMVLALTFDKGSFYRINLNPLTFIYQLKLNYKSTLLEFLSNLVIYIPLGIFIKSICSKKIFKLIFLFIIYIFFIEFLQLSLHRGVFDIIDIITNTLGFTAGLLITSLINFSRKEKTLLKY